MTVDRAQPAGLDPKRCYWCSAPADSKEDLFPRWLDKVELDCPPGHSRVRMRLTRPTRWGPKTEYVNRIGSKKTAVKGVCSTCNNGWMSVLENETKDLLVPMINGRRTTLSLADQLQVARWACMKTSALEADSRSEVGGLTSRSTRDAIHAGSLPIDMAATLSAHDVVLSFRAMRQYGYGLGSAGQPLAQFIATWVLGHLVVQVIGRTGTVKRSVLDDAAQGIRNERRFSIWPPQPTAVEWPPRKIVGIDDLADLCVGPFQDFRRASRSN